MHPMFADWYRLAVLQPDAATLGNRWRVIEEMRPMNAAEWLDVVRLFVGRSHTGLTHGPDFVRRFKDADPLFPLVNNALLVQVLAGAALMDLFATSSPNATLAALALVCADCRGVGEKGPVPAVLPEAQRYLGEEALEQRRPGPAPVTSTGPVEITGDLFDDIEDLSFVNIQGHWPYADNNFTTLRTWNNKLLQALVALDSTVSAIGQRVNAGVQRSAVALVSQEIRALREETDILWWLFGERSRDLDVPVKELGVPAACLVAAKELVDLTVIVPGPVAVRSVLNKALSNAGKVPAAVKLRDAVDKSPRAWREGWADAAEVLDLVPVTRAVARSTEMDEGDAWHSLYNRGGALKADATFQPLDLACQTYDERLLVRAHNHRG